LIINYISITDINKHNYQLLINAVSEERRMRADRFHFIDDSKRSICAEILLQYNLFQTMGHMVNLDISYNKFGKPYINLMDGFSYNLSHSGEWVVIAYGNSEVGVDIERMQEGKEDLADKLFAQEEKSFIYSVEGKERTKRFTQIWTLKESYIKYLGTGLSTSLDSFSVNALEGVVTNQNGEIQRELRLKSYLFDIDYYLSICSVEEEVIFREIKLEELIEFINKNL
jgi:4'-phosphopantetheinyl transferase